MICENCSGLQRKQRGPYLFTATENFTGLIINMKVAGSIPDGVIGIFL